MSKLIILFLVIIALIVIVLAYLFRSVKRFLFSFMPQTGRPQRQDKPAEDVIYKKDDIVVLKGEAKNDKK